MQAQSTILHPVAIGQVMVHFAAHYGVDVDTCLLGTGITEVQLREPDTLITRSQEMCLIENLILALPDVPALGFELGLQYNIATFGIFGFAMRISRNLREAVQQALRYLPLSTAYCRFQLLSDAQVFGVSMDPDSIPQHLRQFLLERDSATALNLFRELGLAGIMVQSLDYRGPEPEYADRIKVLSGMAPRYGRAHNAIVVQREDAEIPLPMYDVHMVRLLEDQCRAQLQRRQVTGVTGQIRQFILGQLGLVASMEDVAQQLEMAPRSLRRRLTEEGTTFRNIVDTERKQLAVQLLQETDMKIDELALQLGYADTASFTRAFRRWVGTSPGEYRRTPRPT